MELEMEGRRPVGRPIKTWSKVVEEGMRFKMMMMIMMMITGTGFTGT